MHENGEIASSPSLLLPSNPTLKPSDPSKHTRIMKNLKSAVLLRLTNSHPNKALSPAQIAAIECGLAQAFPSFRIPTHPTYASMIQTAIWELNEEGGSLESSISQYIMTKYEGLPWAHKRYLSHYLGNLCERGEIMCTSSKRYTLPGIIRQPKSKKKPLRPESGRKRKGHVIDEGTLGGEELISMNEDEFCFEEEETHVFVKNRAKRRSSLVVYEDEEVGGKDVVGREDDMIGLNQIAAAEWQNKLLELNREDEVGKDTELRQQGFGTNDKGNDTVIIEQGLPKTQQKGGTVPQAGLIESSVEELVCKEGRDVVRTEAPPLNYVSSKGRTELLLPLVSSTLEKRLPDECKNEVGPKTLQFDPDSSDANLVSVSIIIVKDSASKEGNDSGRSAELMLSSTGGNHSSTFVSGIDGDACEGMLKKSAILERDDSFLDADLRIVPFASDTHVHEMQKETKPVYVTERKEIIVCGLPCGVPAPLVRKPYCRKNKSKHHQKKPLLSLEKPIPPSPVSPVGPKLLEYKQMSEVSPQTGPATKLYRTLLDSSKLKKSPLQTEQVHTSSPHEMTSMISAEETSLKTELEKQKLHLESLPSYGPLELMSTDDEDLPLQQVVRKCGQKKKLSGLPSSEDTVMPQRNNKLTRSKRKKKQGQKLKSQFKSEGQKCDNVEPDNAATPISEVFSSFRLEEACDNGKKRHEDQEPQLAYSLANAASDKCSVEHRHEKQGDGQVQGSCSHVKLMPETLSLDAQSHELGENQQKKRDQGLSAKVEETTEVSLGESSPPQNQEGQKEERTQQNQTEVSCNLIMEAAATVVCHVDRKQGDEPKDDDQIGCLDFGPTSTRGLGSDNYPGQQLISETFSAKVGSQCQLEWIQEQQGQDHSEAGAMHPQPSFATPVKRERRGRPRKQREGTKDVSDSPPNQLSQKQNKEPKKDGRGWPMKQKEEIEDVAASLNMHNHLQEGSFQADVQLIKNGHGSPRKEKEVTTVNIAAPLNLRDKQKDGPSELAIHQSSFQSLEQKRDGRGRPRKHSVVMNKDAAIPLNLPSQEQEGLFGSATQHQNKQPTRDGRRRPRKQNETVNEDMTASFSLHHQQSQLQSKRPEGDASGTPQKQSEASEEEAAVALDQWLLEGPCKSVVQQNKKPRRDGCGRPPKQDRGTKEDVVVPLNLDQVQKEGLSELATHQMQNKKRKRDGSGRPLNKEAVAALDLDHEQLEPGQAIQQQSQQQSKEIKGDRRGRPRKLEVETKENETTLLHQRQELPIPKETKELGEKENEATLDTSITSLQLDQKKGQPDETDHHNTSPDSELLATAETPLSLGNRSDETPREQKLRAQGDSYKPEASLVSQTLQYQEGILKTIPTPLLAEDESHQQETEHKPHQEEKQLHSPDEQPGKSQDQVFEMTSDQEQETELPVNGTQEQPKEQKEDGGGQLLRSKPERVPLVDQPCQQEEDEQCNQEKQAQLGDQGKTRKQKSTKTRVKVPLSSKNALRSMTKRQTRSQT